MKAGVEREGIEADEACLVEQLWPSTADDYLDDVGDDPGQGDRGEDEEQRRCQPVGHGGKAVSGKDVPPGKKKSRPSSAGRNKRPFAVADFRHRAEEHEHVDRHPASGRERHDPDALGKHRPSGSAGTRPNTRPAAGPRKTDCASLPCRCRQAAKEAEELASDTDQDNEYAVKVMGRLQFSDNTGLALTSHLSNS